MWYYVPAWPGTLPDKSRFPNYVSCTVGPGGRLLSYLEDSPPRPPAPPPPLGAPGSAWPGLGRRGRPRAVEVGEPAAQPVGAAHGGPGMGQVAQEGPPRQGHGGRCRAVAPLTEQPPCAGMANNGQQGPESPRPNAALAVSSRARLNEPERNKTSFILLRQIGEWFTTNRRRFAASSPGLWASFLYSNTANFKLSMRGLTTVRALRFNYAPLATN